MGLFSFFRSPLPPVFCQYFPSFSLRFLRLFSPIFYHWVCPLCIPTFLLVSTANRPFFHPFASRSCAFGVFSEAHFLSVVPVQKVAEMSSFQVRAANLLRANLTLFPFLSFFLFSLCDVPKKAAKFHRIAIQFSLYIDTLLGIKWTTYRLPLFNYTIARSCRN